MGKSRQRKNGNTRHPLTTLDRQIVSALVTLAILFTLVTITSIAKLPSLLKPEQEDHFPGSSTSKGPPSIPIPKAIPKANVHSGKAKVKADPVGIRRLQQTFPVHVGGDMEEIDHPGFLFAKNPTHVKTKVPAFWNPPEYGSDGVRGFLGNWGERLMTPEEAEQVGSFYKKMPTIYVSIASYRDPECVPTVEDVFLRAKHPERVRLAVIDQVKDGDPKCSTPATPCAEDPDQALCRYRHMIDFFEVDGSLSVGPVYARHLAHRMYRGESFAMQVDSHVRMTEHWDDSAIEQWESGKNEMAVIAAYPSDLIGSIDPETHKSNHPGRPIMCMSDFEGYGAKNHLRHGQQPEGVPTVHGLMFEPYWAAGFSFARGHFVVQVPYDQFLPMVFQGEEINIGMRGFTYGYDYYTMEHSVCFHMYAIRENKAKRKNVKLFWENSNNFNGVEAKAMKRLNGKFQED